jgi:hypothetical protein
VHNHVHDCGDNGILVWRLEIGADGTIVMANRVERIPQRVAAAAERQWHQRVPCPHHRLRRDSRQFRIELSDDRQLLHEAWRGRTLRRVRLPGAVIANNIVDNAAMGISVTNFNEGGRLAVTQHLLPQGYRRA